MALAIAIFYLIALVAIGLKWLLTVTNVPDKFALLILAAFFALLAFSLTAMHAGFSG